MTNEREMTVEVRAEETLAGRRYRLIIWKPGGGTGLPGSFSNRARAERVARCIEREMGPEWDREDAETRALIAGLEGV